MTTLFEERDKWSGAILLSLGFHLLLATVVIVAGYFRGARVELWGGTTSGESTIPANLVSAVPLPAPQEPTQNILANESKGITQSIPEKAQEEPQAIPIPDTAKRKPEKTAVTQAPDTRRTVAPPVDNTIPYGQGGPVSGPYGAFKATNAKGGFNFQNGDFGSRYGWYVQVVNSKVSNNWYTTEIGPAVNARRAYIIFDIERDGSPSNVRIEQSSGVPALDQSAVRAVQRIDTFGPPPSGNKVSVEFWFDYQR